MHDMEKVEERRKKDTIGWLSVWCVVKCVKGGRCVTRSLCKYCSVHTVQALQYILYLVVVLYLS